MCRPTTMRCLAVGLFLGAISPASTRVIERQSASSTIYTFNGGASLEGIGVRPNGNLLLSRMDSADIYTLDPSTKAAASKIVTLSGVNSAAAITELGPDIFAVVGGNYTARGGAKAGSWGVWKIDLTGATPKVNNIKIIPESVMFNGLTTLNNDTILIGEGKGMIYRLSVSTGEYSVAIQDASMAPPTSAPIPLGIDGVRYHDGWIYFTNIFKSTFSKVQVDATGKAAGAITPIWTNQMGDDLTFGTDGSIYVCGSGKVVRVSSDSKVSTVASVSSTALAFGKGEKDKSTLYAVSGQGSVYAIPIGA